MAEHLKSRIGTALGLAALALAALAPTAFGANESLNDPTRPPTASTMPEKGAADSALVLQSVLVSPGRKVAVINGQAVKQGDKLGDARVTSIRESEVVLRSDREIKVLKLFPGIEKESRRAEKSAWQ